jgi:hypothetical protein
MSSHHFVKEDQEPAVIMAGSDFREELLGSVLEWCPKVIVIGADVADMLIAAAIKVDECYLLNGQDAPSFPYEMDLLFEGASTAEEVILKWLSKNYLPFYIFGWQNERIIAFFRTLTLEQAHRVTAISLDKKWIQPGGGSFSKWMKKGTELQLTGNVFDWTIRGNAEISWPVVCTTEDGLLTLETNELEIFAEPLYL